MQTSLFVIRSSTSADHPSCGKKLLIKGTHLTLEKVQEISRSFEAVDIQLKAMSGAEDQQVNRVEHRETADQFKGREAKGRCFRCDREGHFSRDRCCPARNAECQKCHKIGHFAKDCQNKHFTSNRGFPPLDVQNKRRSKVNSVGDGTTKAESDDDEYAFTVGGGNAGTMKLKSCRRSLHPRSFYASRKHFLFTVCQ
ncbi:hypothetical protein OS493_020122 [Desmophyllum pertusum]|uniref:CCHC-type domain-containing protein n=1 Tax=Desmophyllum pertusum TaxID=174260 RepID=A0A9X0A094_9CNID|nr:hypothetical protein OS493_020122 [Desmophyllum pertusum]